MNIIIIGNIVALIASSISLFIGIIKNRKKIIYIQTIQSFTYSISNIILGGFSGAIANFVSAIRNILSYKEKLTKPLIILIILISTILTLIFNNLGFVGLLPLFYTIIYTIFINTRDIFRFKILIISTSFFWLIYDITIKAYISAFFDLYVIITSSITAYQIYKSNKIKKQQN